MDNMSLYDVVECLKKTVVGSFFVGCTRIDGHNQDIESVDQSIRHYRTN